MASFGKMPHMHILHERKKELVQITMLGFTQNNIVTFFLILDVDDWTITYIIISQCFHLNTIKRLGFLQERGAFRIELLQR